MQLQDYLQKLSPVKERLVKNYVSVSLNVLNHILLPVSIFAEHLIKVQHLDPRFTRDEQELENLRNILNTLDHFHTEEYDNEIDYDWVKKKLDTVRKGLGWESLSEDSFRKMTDLSNSPLSVPLKVTEYTEVGSNAIDDLRDAVAKITNGLNLKQTEDVLKTIETAEKPKKTKKSGKKKSSLKKLNRKAGSFKEPATRLVPKAQDKDTKFKGPFRRI